MSLVDTDEQYHYVTLAKVKRLYIFDASLSGTLSTLVTKRTPLLYVDFPWLTYYPATSIFQSNCLTTLSVEAPGRCFVMI